MATVKLDLYNEALALLGLRRLSDLNEDREPRHRLDGVYGREAIRYCLEVVKPHFASKTAVLSSPVAGSTLAYSHELPDDYVSVVQAFSDQALDQPISRSLIEGRNLLCDYSTVYLRYTSDSYPLEDWDASFARVVSAYLAKEVAARLAPDFVGEVNGKFNERVEQARQLESFKAPLDRPSAKVFSLTNDWRKVYNDALLILGQPEITTNDDDSDRKVKLDHAVNSGLVENLLEDVSWVFGLVSTKMTYDPSLEPEWGFSRVFKHPTDMERIHGLFMDEMMRCPLRDYNDEGGYIYTDVDTLYLQYVSNDLINSPQFWPAYFKRLVAARLAKDVAMALRQQGADVGYAENEYRERMKEAKNISAMQSPPQKITDGSWNKARRSAWRGYRGRP